MSQTTRNFVPISEQYQLFLLVPPPDEQRAIAAILDASFDRLRELTETTNGAQAQLDQLNQSILAKAFRGELVPQDPNDESASTLLERIREQRAQQVGATKRKKKTATTRQKSEIETKSAVLASPRQLLADMRTAKSQPMAPEQLLLEY